MCRCQMAPRLGRNVEELVGRRPSQKQTGTNTLFISHTYFVTYNRAGGRSQGTKGNSCLRKNPAAISSSCPPSINGPTQRQSTTEHRASVRPRMCVSSRHFAKKKRPGPPQPNTPYPHHIFTYTNECQSTARVVPKHSHKVNTQGFKRVPARCEVQKQQYWCTPNNDSSSTAYNSTTACRTDARTHLDACARIRFSQIKNNSFLFLSLSQPRIFYAGYF